VRHASRSSGLFGVEASLARVSQSGLKTGGCKVAPSQMLRRRQGEDGRIDATGCIRPCYPWFAVFFLLGLRDVVVI
jgi:hypothetical protein